eukprot:3134648-Prymnesium_polylepis.1
MSGQGMPTRWSIHAVKATGGTAMFVGRSFAVSRADAPNAAAWVKRAMCEGGVGGGAGSEDGRLGAD